MSDPRCSICAVLLDPDGGCHDHGYPDGWPRIDRAAFRGVAAAVVDEITPHSEADPVALLLDLLVSFGSAAGAGPHAEADAARHPARLFVVGVGKTARARKGTARANIGRVFSIADPDWTRDRVVGGLSSGEGLIAAVAGDDNALADRRLLVYEPEFSRVLRVCAREGSILSAVLRDSWDRGELRVMTRNQPLAARGAHISIIGHVTIEELRRALTQTDAANGFANRFLFACVRRSKRLPSGGTLAEDELGELGRLVGGALQAARRAGRMRRSPDAEALWREIYLGIDDDVDGLLGAITARAEAQMLRLSVTYALLDGSAIIEPEHLLAAKAVWGYCEASARYIWRGLLGDEITDRLYDALLQAGEAGLDYTQQSAVFNRHVSAARIEVARESLTRRGLIVTEGHPTDGRSRMVTRAAKKANLRIVQVEP